MTDGSSAEDMKDPVVSAEWLHARLGQSDLAILDATLPPVGVVPPVDTRARFRQEHLPGAVFFDIDEIADHATSLPHMLPEEESFARMVGALGLAETMTLVVYEQEGVFSAPRARWMLRTMGAPRVYLLDGGLRAWREAGYPIEEGEARPLPVTFHAHRDASAVRSLEEVQSVLRGHAEGTGDEQIVDARPAARFAGSAPEPRAGIASGHMPGAYSVPSGSMTRDGRLKTPTEARKVFLQAGVDLGSPVVTTCGSGVTAAILALQLERIGARKVSLYDGSWAEYAGQPEANIVRGEAIEK